MEEPLNSASIVAELSAPKAGLSAREQAKVKKLLLPRLFP